MSKHTVALVLATALLTGCGSASQVADPVVPSTTSSPSASAYTEVRVSITINGETCQALPDGGYDDFEEGASVTLVTGSNSDAEVVASSSWGECIQDRKGVTTYAYFRIPSDSDPMMPLGLDSAGTRPIFWSSLDRFPLDLILGD
jgi:hypothetical protein